MFQRDPGKLPLLVLGFLVSANTISAQEIVDVNRMKLLKGHDHGIEALVFSSNGKQLFSGGGVVIKIWDVALGKETRTIKAHGQAVKTLAVSQDGNRLISGGWEGAKKIGEKCVKIWDLKKDAPPVGVWTADVMVHAVALSPNEKYFATGGRDKTLRLWDCPSGELRRASDAHPRDIQGVAFSPDSKMLTSCGYDSETKIWEVDSGKLLTAIANVGTRFHWDAVSFSPNGKYLAMAGTGLRVIEVDGGKEIFQVNSDEVQTASLCWSFDGKLLATGGMDKVVRIFDGATGKELAMLKGHQTAIQIVRFSPDGRWIASGAQNDSDIRLWPLTKPAAKQ